MLRQFSGPIRTLIDNQFVFEPFWEALRDQDASNQWERSFAASKKAALAALMQDDTTTALTIVFDQLYMLRNQLVHGGGAWNGKVNRGQVRDGASILGTLLPLVLAVMLAHQAHPLGEALYPVV